MNDINNIFRDTWRMKFNSRYSFSGAYYPYKINIIGSLPRDFICSKEFYIIGITYFNNQPMVEIVIKQQHGYYSLSYSLYDEARVYLSDINEFVDHVLVDRPIKKYVEYIINDELIF